MQIKSLHKTIYKLDPLQNKPILHPHMLDLHEKGSCDASVACFVK